MNVLRPVVLITLAAMLAACSSSESDWKKADAQNTVDGLPGFPAATSERRACPAGELSGFSHCRTTRRGRTPRKPTPPTACSNTCKVSERHPRDGCENADRRVRASGGVESGANSQHRIGPAGLHPEVQPGTGSGPGEGPVRKTQGLPRTAGERPTARKRLTSRWPACSRGTPRKFTTWSSFRRQAPRSSIGSTPVR